MLALLFLPMSEASLFAPPAAFFLVSGLSSIVSAGLSVPAVHSSKVLPGLFPGNGG